MGAQTESAMINVRMSMALACAALRYVIVAFGAGCWASDAQPTTGDGSNCQCIRIHVVDTNTIRQLEANKSRIYAVHIHPQKRQIHTERSREEKSDPHTAVYTAYTAHKVSEFSGIPIRLQRFRFIVFFILCASVPINIRNGECELQRLFVSSGRTLIWRTALGGRFVKIQIFMFLRVMAIVDTSSLVTPMFQSATH